VTWRGNPGGAGLSAIRSAGDFVVENRQFSPRGPLRGPATFGDAQLIAPERSDMNTDRRVEVTGATRLDASGNHNGTEMPRHEGPI
jgi:hypothetical protein